MKRNIFITIFTLIFAFSLAGCGENKGSDNMMSDIRNGMQSAEDKVESGIDKAEDKIDNGINNAEDALDGTGAKISRDKAKQIALEHAKLKESDVKNYHIELDKDNGHLEYDIEFNYNGAEYDYEIDADTGEIRSHSKDIED